MGRGRAREWAGALFEKSIVEDGKQRTGADGAGKAADEERKERWIANSGTQTEDGIGVLLWFAESACVASLFKEQKGTQGGRLADGDQFGWKGKRNAREAAGSLHFAVKLAAWQGSRGVGKQGAKRPGLTPD